MVDPEDGRLIARAASRLYGAGQAIWDPADRWNSHKRAEIERFCQPFQARLSAADRVLDAGCGCQAYEWLPQQTVSLDRFWEQVRIRKSPVVADLRALPFRDGSFQAAICVASVLNYVDAVGALSELGRVIQPGGLLLLHFESSTSFEHVGSRRWRASAARLDTINNGKPDSIWIYRPSFVWRVLTAAGFKVTRSIGFHTMSALGLRLGLKQHSAAKLAALDPIARWLKPFADDVILSAEKHASEDDADVGGGQRAQ